MIMLSTPSAGAPTASILQSALLECLKSVTKQDGRTPSAKSKVGLSKNLSGPQMELCAQEPVGMAM